MTKYTLSDVNSKKSILYAERNNLKHEGAKHHVENLLSYYKIKDYEFKMTDDKQHYINDYLVLFVYYKDIKYMLWFDENEKYIDEAINVLKIDGNIEKHKKYKGKLDSNWKYAIEHIYNDMRYNNESKN